MTEEWRPIRDFPKYQVSNLGRIKGPLKILTPITGSFGYQQVNLYRNKAGQTNQIHILVLEAFVSEKPEGYEAHHKDGNKNNNRANNLEWVTRQEHLTKHSNNILTIEQVQEIRQRYAAGGVTQIELAREFGYSQVAMHQIIQNKRRKEK